MSVPTDLLPYGESFAELDLVVRQLDDGSLTVTDDDTRSDEDRVQVLADEDGLRAEVRVAALPAPAPAGLGAALARLGQRESFAWRDGYVLCEAVLPWTPDEQFALGELEALYRCVADAAQAYGPQLERVARGELAVDDLTAAEAVAVPPSYLPGAGQSDRSQSLTNRYGSLEQVPGRAEVGAGERPSQRVRALTAAQPEPPESATGVAAVMVVGLIGLAGLAAFAILRGGPSDPAGPPAADTAAADPSGEAAPPSAGEDPDPAVSTAPATGAGDDVVAPRSPERDLPAPTPQRRSLDDEASILAAAAAPDEELRRRAVQRWIALGLDRGEGARLRLLEALSRRIDREVGLMLLDSFRARPVKTLEALDCLEWANTGIRRHLIRQLGQPGQAHVGLIVEMLREQEETEDLLVEEALLRLGQPKDGAALRLVAKRGIAWVQLGEGKELFERLPVPQIEPLVRHSDPELRLVACDLLKTKEPGREMLALLLDLLKDSDPRVQRRAIEALTAVRDPRSSWALARALRGAQDGLTKDMLERALEALPTQDAVGYLGALLRKPELDERLAAIEALQAIAKPQSVAVLVQALRDDAREVRLAALEALQALTHHGELEDEIAKGILYIRRLAADTSDREARRLARQLHYSVEGRMPPG